MSILGSAAWNWSVQDIESYLYQRSSAAARNPEYQVIYSVFTDLIQECLNARTPFIYDSKRKSVRTVEVPVMASTVPLTDFYSAFAWMVSASQPEISHPRDGLRILATFSRLCDTLHRHFFSSSSARKRPAIRPASINLICGWLSVELSESAADIPSSITPSALEKMREARKWYIRDMWRLSDPPSYYPGAEYDQPPRQTACISLPVEAMGKLRKYKDTHVCAHANELCLSCGCWVSLPTRPIHCC